MTEKRDWVDFFKAYNNANAGRPTRIGVFETEGGATNDYWLEDGLPFVGIDQDRGDGRRSVQIVTGAMTHTVRDAVRVSFHFGTSTERDGIDVLAADGGLTVVRFESV